MASPDLTSNPYWAEDVKVGKQYGISPYLLSAQQYVESGWNPAAVSPTGAFGLSQFEPGTAAEYGVQQGTSTSAVDSQITGEAKYLTALYKEEGNSWQTALEAYNAGPGGVANAAGNGASAYASEILNYARGHVTALGKGFPGASGNGSGTTTGGGGGSSSSPIINRSMLVRVGIGVMAVACLLIGASHLSGQTATQTRVQLPSTPPPPERVPEQERPDDGEPNRIPEAPTRERPSVG